MLNLKRVLILGAAIFQELRSSHAITHGPCAYLVAHCCGDCAPAYVYLDFTQLVRDLVRLQCYAVLGTYQEEDHCVYTAQRSVTVTVARCPSCCTHMLV